MSRRFQFSLRIVLIVLTGASILLGIVTSRAHRQRDAVREIEALGGVIYYDYHDALRTARAVPVGAVRYDRNREAPQSGWLQTLIGDHFFHKVEFVDLSGSGATEAQIAEFTFALPHATIKTPLSKNGGGPTMSIVSPLGGGDVDAVLVAMAIVVYAFFAWVAVLCVRRVMRKEKASDHTDATD